VKAGLCSRSNLGFRAEQLSQLLEKQWGQLFYTVGQSEYRAKRVLGFGFWVMLVDPQPERDRTKNAPRNLN